MRVHDLTKKNWQATAWTESRDLLYNDVRTSSPYGDPELALIAHESIDLEGEEKLDAQIEARQALSKDTWECLKLFCQTDRIILTLRFYGWTQYEIAGLLGMSQPSVCNRITKLRWWLERNVSLRARVRAAFPEARGLPKWLRFNIRLPKRFLKYDEDALWHHILYEHGSPTTFANLTGVAWTTIYCRTKEWLRLATEPGSRATAEQVALLTILFGDKHGTRAWTPPIENSHRDDSRRRDNPKYGH